MVIHYLMFSFENFVYRPNAVKNLNFMKTSQRVVLWRLYIVCNGGVSKHRLELIEVLKTITIIIVDLFHTSKFTI